MNNLTEQVERIKTMMGLLIEQSGSLVPEKVYELISAIESKYSYMKDGKINTKTYTGREVEQYIKSYIDKTIGENNWNKISDKLKAQIYSFAFQSDSGYGGMKFKWIAGLANAINQSINRGDIVGKPIDDPNVQNAIKTIKTACENGSINTVYNKYLSIIDQQYKSMDYSDNYKYIWKYRPIAVDRIMSGTDINTVLNDWEKSFNKTNTDQPTQPSNGQLTNETLIDIIGIDMNDLRTKLKTETKSISVNIDRIKVDMTKYRVSYNPGNTKIQGMSLIFDPNQDTLNTRFNSIKEKNPTIKLIESGNDNGYYWNLSIIL